jgi:TRAP-type mannitol/chloroaromatic compound transport system permease small subunit
VADQENMEQGNMLSRGFSKFVAALNSAGSALILAIVVMINLDVFSRFLFNKPIDGVTELVELSIVAIVFLQLGDAVRNGRLTRSAGLYDKLCAKKPRTGHALGVFFDLAGAAFFLTIIAGSIPRFIDAWERGYYAGNKGIFVVPVWPVRLILIIGASTVVLVFLGLVMKHIRALRAAPAGDQQ